MAALRTPQHALARYLQSHYSDVVHVAWHSPVALLLFQSTLSEYRENCMLRPVFIACALIASATCAARPMVIRQSQTLEPPAGSGYYVFGYEVAIDGDWAIIMAATPYPTPTSPRQTHDALLYHRVNGQWTFDRVLIRRVSTEYGQNVGFASVAMNNGVAAIGSNPTRIFRRTDNNWTEIAHPFTAPPDDPDGVAGDLVWDGSRLLAEHGCYNFQPRPWGALISRLNADGSWTPFERLSSGDTFCNQSAVHWGISGNTVVAGTWTRDYEIGPDQLRIFRRTGTTWIPTSAIDGGDGEGDVRGNDIFFSSPEGTLVYRNDDSHTVVDIVRTVSASYRDSGGVRSASGTRTTCSCRTATCSARTPPASTSTLRCSCHAVLTSWSTRPRSTAGD